MSYSKILLFEILTLTHQSFDLNAYFLNFESIRTKKEGDKKKPFI